MLPLSEFRVLRAKILELLGGSGEELGRCLTVADVVVTWLLPVSSFVLDKSAICHTYVQQQRRRGPVIGMFAGFEQRFSSQNLSRRCE